ncbi:hypothetical protein [Streptomyces rubiginosohelvolus]|uniref:hypothetical protein n=1 Tax=Streptomyces rubiginosohelvolus TaxID=67362 RepID=UPI0036543402
MEEVVLWLKELLFPSVADVAVLSVDVNIEWVDYRRTAELPIFPPVGAALAALPHPRATVTDAALEAVTDDNYT